MNLDDFDFEECYKEMNKGILNNLLFDDDNLNWIKAANLLIQNHIHKINGTIDLSVIAEDRMKIRNVLIEIHKGKSLFSRLKKEPPNR